MRRSISFFEVEQSSRKPMIDINGMAHVISTVPRYDKAMAFYARLMPAMGLETVFDNVDLPNFVGARTAVGIQPCKPESQVSVSRKRASDCIIFARVRIRAKTSTRLTRCRSRWTRISLRLRRKATERADTITFCLNTRTASASR